MTWTMSLASVPVQEVPGFRNVIHPHIGWIVAVTRSEQTSNAHVGTAFGVRQTVFYDDPIVHAKRAWRDYLNSKYGTINALNAAWGASYTTFESDGGWPHGRGLLDESGHHPWIGTDAERLGRTPPSVRVDLDAFLEVFANRYFSVVTAAARAATPRHLVFSPAMLNGHKGLTRREIPPCGWPPLRCDRDQPQRRATRSPQHHTCRNRRTTDDVVDGFCRES